MIRFLVLLTLLRSQHAYQQRQASFSRLKSCPRCNGKARNSLPSSSAKRIRNVAVMSPAPRVESESSLQLSSTDGSAGDQSNNKNNGWGRGRIPNPLKPIRKGVTKMLKARARLTARFQALPRRAKRIVIAYMLLVSLAFGSLARNVVYHSAPPPPVEISYSSFLDLVDGQAVDSNYNSPTMTQVRIGKDRIVYRLYNKNSEKSSTTTSSSSNKAQQQQQQQPNNLQLELPSLSSRAARRLAQQQASRPYLSAYTRPIPDTVSPQLLDKLRAREISFAAAPAPRTSTVALAVRTFMVGFYFLILFRLYKTVSGASGNSKSDTPGRLAQTSDLPLASFDEIQGIDGAKTEVMELVDSLRNPDKYAILGARAPTGLLLVGPPGTGKTMLARATAATAGVPLLYCSGSDFVEMFVGRGAARVRKLFERAEKLSPCIVFIDELDALGKSRDMGGGMGAFSRSNDEAEQTLNQLLACMDGLDSSRRICVLAATNRKEVLDQALIRPGRFDRIVKLELPDAKGREKILRVHTSKLPGFTEGSGVDPNRMGALGKGRLVDLSAIAALTDGFSGAELEFLVNEAAIRAVRRVSSALQRGTPQQDIVPHVEARDFEESLRSFYETRKPKGGGVNDILKNVWKQ